ncbi:uncharacterized protein LOC144066670 [Stigmatopora argus]
MQDGTPRGPSSELSASLKAYLNDGKRLQPIVGLRCITECVAASPGGDGEAVYLCEVCVRRLSKSDVRNHIVGSLHRYNYVKACHPHLLPDGKRSDAHADVSLLARPLMDVARTLEEKEGPGDIRLLRAEGSAFQRLSGGGDDDEAIRLLRALMGGAGEPESLTSDHREDEGDEVPAAVDRGDHACPSLEIPPTFGHTLRDRYKGPRPVIGLFRVTECVCEEDGRTSCFLCHCCRTRVTTRLFVPHVSGSDHALAYLMETQRERASRVGAGPTDSLAAEVEREEGRGDMEVLAASRFLCRQLARKNYHWCIRVLWKVNYPGFGQGERAKKGLKGKKRGGGAKCSPQSGVVFKVNLPLSRGPLLLERTSFGPEASEGDPDGRPEEEGEVEVEGWDSGIPDTTSRWHFQSPLPHDAPEGSRRPDESPLPPTDGPPVPWAAEAERDPTAARRVWEVQSVHAAPPFCGIPQRHAAPPFAGIPQPHACPRVWEFQSFPAAPPFGGIPQRHAAPPFCGIPQRHAAPPFGGTPQRHAAPQWPHPSPRCFHRILVHVSRPNHHDPL